MSKVDIYNCVFHNKGESLTVLPFSCLILLDLVACEIGQMA